MYHGNKDYKSKKNMGKGKKVRGSSGKKKEKFKVRSFCGFRRCLRQKKSILIFAKDKVSAG